MQQTLVFFGLLASVIITWPQMGEALGRLLTRHAQALRMFYAYLLIGWAAYWDSMSGSESGIERVKLSLTIYEPHCACSVGTASLGVTHDER